MRKSTAVRRRVSSSIVPASLKSGTTIDSCTPLARLRDIPDTPLHWMREVMANQLDTLGEEPRARLHAAEQLHFRLPRLDEARAGAPQGVVGGAGVDHELRDAAPDR